MMLRKLLLTAVGMACSAMAMAQLIDLDLAGRTNVTETDYVAWAVATGTNGQLTVDGVTLTVTNTAQSTANCLQSNWWKDGVNKYSKLVCDGITPKVLQADGNRTEPTGCVELQLTLTGLPAGEHTLLAYHNNVDGYTPAVLPPVMVSVQGSNQPALSVEQTLRAETPSAAARSFITFTAREGEPVVIVYFTEPDAATTYSTTSFYINALEIDVNPFAAQDPTPAHYDLHTNADEGRLAFSWKPAPGAVGHRVVVSTDSLQAATGTTYIYEGADTTFVEQGTFYPTLRYYWRVDEVMNDGHVYQGRVWTFQPRRLAFPDAEGYGRYAIGGRGGTVYHVTSLSDDVQQPQPGTLRYGLTQVSGPRTIVFDVAGTITLQGRLMCSDPYVTIAGQTAPGHGILLRGAPLGMASDGITRFLRMRLGYHNGNTDKGLDGLGMAGNDHSIMDHCSISWTIDEGFSSRGAKNITLQRTLISEALNVADHPNYEAGKGHGYAATIGGGENGGLGSSFHHNLLAHNEGRNWSMSGGLDGSGAYDGHHDMFNNVVYNWGSRATDGGTHEGQFVANYYKMGPSTTKTVLLQADLEGTGSSSQAYYVHGNIREALNGQLTTDALGDTYLYRVTSSKQQVDWTVFQDEPFFPSYANVETAEAAFRSVLSDVGCNEPFFDNHDARMVNETLLGTTSTTGSITGKAGLIDRETDAEGFEGLNIIEAQRPNDWDTDQDGVPNWFEIALGTDPLTPSNNEVHTVDELHDYYTDLERYLDFMGHPHYLIAPENTVSISLPALFAGFRQPVFQATGGMLAPDGVLTVGCGNEKLWTLAVTATEGDVSMTRLLHFCATDAATGILSHFADATPPSALSEAIYNLQGQRLHQLRRGVNIRGGRKFLVR